MGGSLGTQTAKGDTLHHRSIDRWPLFFLWRHQKGTCLSCFFLLYTYIPSSPISNSGLGGSFASHRIASRHLAARRPASFAFEAHNLQHNTSNIATTSSDTIPSHHSHGDQHSTTTTHCAAHGRQRPGERAGHHVIQVRCPPPFHPQPPYLPPQANPPGPPPHRFPSSTLHQRDSRNDLFKGYTGGAGSSSRTATASPSRLNPSSSGNYGGGGYNASPSHGLGGSNTTTPGYGNNFRPATPNARGQYSDAVLNELESQNDAQVDGILGKVKILKDVSPLNPPFPPPRRG